MKKEETINVIIKEPSKPAKVKAIPNTLEAFQEAVGGYIEVVTICTDLVIVCNEEGRLRGLPYNCNLFGADFVGPIVIAECKGDEFSSLPSFYEELKLRFE